ncbi:MAG: hypothetical protein ACXWPM_03010 [Bdellovibrionota bacterium]
MQSKNRCLNRFLELSIGFQGEADAGDLSGLSDFLSRRDALIQTLELYDQKIDQAVALLPASARDAELVESIRVELEARTRMIHQILMADEKIMRKVEAEKARLLAELNSNTKTQTQLNKFKSTWIREAGEELDTKL